MSRKSRTFPGNICIAGEINPALMTEIGRGMDEKKAIGPNPDI